MQISFTNFAVGFVLEPVRYFLTKSGNFTVGGYSERHKCLVLRFFIVLTFSLPSILFAGREGGVVANKMGDKRKVTVD